MANDDRTQGSPPTAVHLGPEHKSSNWLPWLLLALGVLALLWFLARRGDNEQVVTTTTTTTEQVAPAVTPAVTATDGPTLTESATASVSGLSAYLEGGENAPRTFVFDNLNFATGAAEIRPQDQTTVAQVADVMQRYPNARARLVGYADARGDATANAGLGQRRAEALKAALVAAGVEDARLEAESGGETTPLAANDTAAGMAENRRAEFVVTAR